MTEDFEPLYSTSAVDNMRNDDLRTVCQKLGLKRPTGGRLKNDRERRAALKKYPKQGKSNAATIETDTPLEAGRPEKHRRSLSDPSLPRPAAKRRGDEANARRSATRFRTGDEKFSLRAFENQVKLEGFHLSNFREAREKGKVPLNKGVQWKPMAQGRTQLTHDGGPAVVVDEDNKILFLYLPGFAKEATQHGLREKINELREYQSLKWDDEKRNGDSRAGIRAHGMATLVPPATIHRITSNPELGPRRSERIQAQEAKKAAKISEAKELSMAKYGLEVVVEEIVPLPEPPFLKGREPEDDSEREDSGDEEASSTNMAGVRGGSWHLCLAWFQLGQHRKLPPQMSVDLRTQTDNELVLSLKTNLFAWKSLVDMRINNIVRWWFPTFYQAVVECKRMILENVQPRPPKPLIEKWESIYPHLALGYNRTTHKHRDCGGVIHGLDCLLLTGDFSGGDLYLQDLNLQVEWKAGDFCAFDGKLFTHEVGVWEGSERMCFIYFVKRNIFEYYGIETPLDPPALEEVGTLDET